MTKAAACMPDRLGLVPGVYALTRIDRDGRKGVLGPAIAGTTINGLLVLLFITVFYIATNMRH